MSDINWEDPPGRSRGGPKPKHAEFFAALRKHPGQWAVFAEDASQTAATSIRKGVYAGTKPGEFESRCVRPEGNGSSTRGRIYARYVGTDGGAS